jgi:predicted nucleic acid-binding protein
MKSLKDVQDTDIIALDSNVLLYAYDTSQGKKHELALELLKDGLRGEATYFVPLQVLSEFYSVVSRGKINVPRDAALQIVKDMLALPNFITNQTDEFSIIEAIGINEKSDIPFWDAMIVVSMKKRFVTSIYTENTKHFNLPWLKAVNPFSE